MADLGIACPPRLSRGEYKALSPGGKEAYIREFLRQTLRMNRGGLTMSQLMREVSFDRRIVEKHLDFMEFSAEIYVRRLGSNKIYVPNSRMQEATGAPAHLGSEECMVYLLDNELGSFAVIRREGAGGGEPGAGGTLQVPLEHFEALVEYLGRAARGMERRSA